MTATAAGTHFTGSTLVDLLRWRASSEPDVRAYTFLRDDEEGGVHMTFGELDRRARMVATLLRSIDAEGRTILLVFPSGLEFAVAFFGCLYAGAIAATVYPPRPNRSLRRFSVIARDSKAKVVLTVEAVRTRVEASAAELEGLDDLKWIAVDRLTDGSPAEWQPPTINSDSLAFLQYTSGSTASPNGTMISHGNVLHNSSVICDAFELTRDSVGVGWLPMTHDMGLIGNLLQPLYAGFPLIFMAPEHFLVKPVRWLKTISRYGATASGGPNFAYDFCWQKIKPEQRRELDLSSWTVAFSGAEAVRPETIDRFSAAFAECGFRREAFYPCFGLAESTLMVTGGAVPAPPVERRLNVDALKENRAVLEDDAEASRVLIGCGRARPNLAVVVVDPETRRLCPEGGIGEIWVAGPSVAQGYWQQPQLTSEVFEAELADTGEGPFLRTGDLGFFLEGELFITGRHKDLIIIGGANHFPVDIEITVEKCHPAIRANCVAAVSADIDGTEKLVIVAEIERRQEKQVEDIAGAVREAVARSHDLSAHAICLIRQSTVPRTSSGKIQRHLCRTRYLAGELMLVEDRSNDRRN